MREEPSLILRPPKSPKRFNFLFSPTKTQPPPLPPLPTLTPFTPPWPLASYPSSEDTDRQNRKSHTPSSSTSSARVGELGQGAQVVRTPSDALKGIRHHITPLSPSARWREPITPTSGKGSSMEELRQGRPDTAPLLRHQKSEIRPVTPGRSFGLIGGGGDGDERAAPRLKDPPIRQSMSRRKRVEAGEEVETVDSHSSFSSFESAHYARFSPLSPAADEGENSVPREKYHLSSEFGQSLTGAFAGDMPSRFEPFRTSPSKIASPPALAPDETRERTRSLRRTTIRPARRDESTTSAAQPFTATLLSKTVKPSPTALSHILIRLEFGFSTDDPPDATGVTIPWPTLRVHGGELVRWLDALIPDGEAEGKGEGQPEMTDGSSAEESDSDEFDLNRLLRWVRESLM